MAITTVLLGCEQDGYRRFDDNIQYKILSIGPATEEVEEGTYAFIALDYRDASDSSFIFTNRLDKSQNSKIFWFPNDTEFNDLRGLFLRMEAGDSLQIVANQDVSLLDSLSEGKAAKVVGRNVLIQAKIESVMTPEQFTAWVQKEEWRRDQEMNEQISLQAYLDSTNIEFTNYGDVKIHWVANEPTEPLKTGQFVTVEYVAYSIHGQIFDDTRAAGNPLNFELGRPDQVLPGFNQAIRKMSQGDKAIVLIPSHLAFGERGATNGSVPPYTTVIYELEVVGVSG